MKTLKISIMSLLIIVSAGIFDLAQATQPRPYYYLIKVYHYKTKAQENVLDAYLKDAYKPAVKRMFGESVGVFKTLETDTNKRIYVFTPIASWDKMETFEQKLAADNQYQTDAKAYLEAAYNDSPFTRYETIVLRAFNRWRLPWKPETLTAPMNERIYELRSYEGPTEKYYQNKVKMFNDGGETVLFARLHFNAVFYASVLYGSHQPNLMYMTTFNNMADRDKHWETFGNDPEWKKLVAAPEYQHNVSHADIIFLHPAEYSDY